MTTRGQMRESVRNFLKDTTTKKASDAELDDYLDFALADYSYHFPRKLVAEYTNLQLLTPPTDMVPNGVEAVEVDDSLWPQVTLGSTKQGWFWYGENIKLSRTASVARVHYRGLHAFIVPEGFTVPLDGDGHPIGELKDYGVLTVPKADEELLQLYAAAKFHQKVGTIAAKLDRFREKGERDDNPLIMMHDVLMWQYHQKIDDRIKRGTVLIRSR